MRLVDLKLLPREQCCMLKWAPLSEGFPKKQHGLDIMLPEGWEPSCLVWTSLRQQGQAACTAAEMLLFSLFSSLPGSTCLVGGQRQTPEMKLVNLNVQVRAFQGYDLGVAGF